MLEEIKKILEPIELPEIVKVRQKFDDLALPNVRETLMQKMEERNLDIKPGQRIAITCGSRGVDQYPVMIKAVVDFVKSKGAQPILIPAMGSHGGATAEVGTGTCCCGRIWQTSAAKCARYSSAWLRQYACQHSAGTARCRPRSMVHSQSL